MSDHGFQTGQLRPSGQVNFTPGDAMEWHRPYGILCMAGPGIRHDELIFGAGLLDIAPTILHLFGLPAGEDMPGRLLAEVFDNPVMPERIASWESVPGESGMHARDAHEDSWEAAAVVERLIALGYVAPRDGDVAKQLELSRRHQAFSLAQVHLAAGRSTQAIPILQELVRADPGDRVYRLFLAQVYLECGRLDACRAAVEPVLIDEDADRPGANLVRANLAIAEGDLQAGLQYLLRAEHTSKVIPELRLTLGRVYLRLGRWEDAERAFRATLEIDSDNAAAYVGLASVALGTHDAAGAASAAMEAIALRFDDAVSHYLLGAALVQLGEPARAAGALKTCLSLRPQMTEAQKLLTTVQSCATYAR